MNNGARALLVAWWLAIGAAAATAETPQDQQQAKQRLEAVQHEIAKLQQQLATARAEHRAGQQELRGIDLALQASSRTLRSLDAQLSEHRQRLRELERERDTERARVQAQEHELAGLLVSTYRLARQSRLKLVLNQDDPALLARLLAYHDRINRSQARRITALREALSHLETLYRSVDAELDRLEKVRQRQREAVTAQQRQRAERAELVNELARRIGSEEEQLAALERDRADLETLIARLGDALADIPADLGRHAGVLAQKGQLAMPVTGAVRHAFGQLRAAGLRWQGWLIDARPGTEVHSIGYGRVAFADWFRGYGLMLIVDHGHGVMSLYGYNESLLWDVGDWVKPGDVIATVGSGPGGEQGLYFELRRDGKPVDPAAWLQR